MSFKVKRRILNIIAVIFGLALLLFYKFLTQTEIGVTVLVIFTIVYFILTLKWWRCPHCNTYFWKLPPFAEHCPHCGNKLE